MERKNILAAASALLMVALTLAMNEDEELAFTLQMSKETAQPKQYTPTYYSQSEDDQALQEALRLSEESAKKEQEAILKPGIHQEYVDIIQRYRVGSPVNLNEAVPFKVYQIAVNNPQSGENVSCGPRVLFIAAAIDRLHREKRPISTQGITKVLAENNDYTKAIEECVMQLDSDDIPAFIASHKLEIQKYFVMGRYESKEGIYPISPYIPKMPETYTDIDAWLKDFTRSLTVLAKNLKFGRIDHPIHFIFSSTQKTHWVLISIIKGERTNPVTYYIDPKNVDIKKYPAAHVYLEYVAENMELPFLQDTLKFQSSSSSSSK